MAVTRQSWEPAHVKFFYAALASAKTVFSGIKIVHAITATNSGSAATTMEIEEGSTQIGTLSVPANTTAAFPIPSSGVELNGLTVTPAAALDVTILVA
jgi:hypothetical protein